MINKKCIWTVNYDSLNKNTISLKLHNRTEKNHNHRIQLFGGKITILVHFLYTILLTIRIAFIKFKRSHIENEFRQLDKFTLNLSIFFSEMVSLQSPF